MQFLKVGTSGIRGKVSEGLTPQNVINYVSAFGTYLESKKVVVGHDTRYSSNMFYNAVLATLVSCGYEVLEIELCTTAELSFMI
ncbi:MAG: phosphoglucosamine mutase, partial [Lentisphaeria bacterium]